MASVIEFLLTGEHTAARDVVLGAITANGFAARPTDDWRYELSRGNKRTSFWLGAMAGSKFYLTFSLDFSVDISGALVARLSRDVVGNALRGGAIGAGVASTEFQIVVDSVGAATSRAAIYSADRVIS